MSVVTKTVSVVSSVDAFLALAVGLVADVKAGKSPAIIVGDVVPSLISALTGVGELKTDILDRKDLEVTVALRFAEVVNILAP